MRTIPEILKQADSSNKLKDLISLWNEIAENKYKYPLIQIRFANEHLRNLALNLKSDDQDIEIAMFYKSLEEMNPKN